MNSHWTPSQAGHLLSRVSLLTIGLAVASVLDAPSLLAQPASKGAWDPVKSLSTAPWLGAVSYRRYVLFQDASGSNYQLYDPASNQTGFTDAPAFNHGCGGLAQLPDGRVLLVDGPHNVAEAGASIFDPSRIQELFPGIFGCSDCFSSSPPTAPPAYGRYYPTVTALAGGKMLLIGGNAAPPIPELFNPFGFPSWVSLPAYNDVCAAGSNNVGIPMYPFMHVLSDNRVLYAGGNESGAHCPRSRILNTANGTWTEIDPNPDPILGESVVMHGKDAVIKAEQGLAYRLTPFAPQKWTQLASLDRTYNFYLIALPDGKLIAVNGLKSDSTAAMEPELYDPANDPGGWVKMAPMSPTPDFGDGRAHHGLGFLLHDGRVLVAGGEAPGPPYIGLVSKSLQIYRPPYLFHANGSPISDLERPVADSAYVPTLLGTGTTFSLAPNHISPGQGATQVTKACLIRPGAGTHENDMDQRYIPLNFFWGTKNVAAPATAEEAPPGYYMLFFMNNGDNGGHPSLARPVRLWGILQTSVSHTPPQVNGSSFTITISWRTNIPATVGDEIVFKKPGGASLTVPCSGQSCSITDNGLAHSATVTVPECLDGTWSYQLKSKATATSESRSQVTTATRFTLNGCSEPGFLTSDDAPERTFIRVGTANPAGGALDVRFALTTTGPVTITVHSITGALVRTLVNEALPAGQHVRRWDGADDRGDRAAPGVYFFKLRTPAEVHTDKNVYVSR